MSATIRFDGQVAVVTGAGGGLGRTYCLLLASRGAKVVVNDFGGPLAGGAAGAGRSPADDVVDLIRSMGKEATPNYDSVEHGERIVQTAIDVYGRIDILINNAGILRDVSFAKMTPQDWESVIKVHLTGTFICCRAAWPHMRKQQYGRIVNTASASGMYGNFGQANYGSAKLGIFGLTRTLAVEGERANIMVNCVAPLAGTRMTETILPKEIVQKLQPEYVAPVVVFLVSNTCTTTGQLVETGGCWVARVRWQRSVGHDFGQSITPELVQDKWMELGDFSRPQYPESLQDSLKMVTQSLHNSPPPVPSFSSASASASVADKLFGLMGAFLERQPAEQGKALIRKVGACFHFDILPRKGATSPSASYTIDLKNGTGSVRAEKDGTADATFSMVEDDFKAVCLGTLNPQVAFMQGKMKIKGNMRAATKFTPDLFPKIDASLLQLSVPEAIDHYIKTLGGKGVAGKVAATLPEGPRAAPELSAEASQLKSAGLLDLIRTHLKSESGRSLITKVGCVYRFDIVPRKGASPIPFTIDLKNGSGALHEGAPDTFDAHFTMLDDDFAAIVTGQLNPQMAFMRGKMKIKGNMRAAMKFTPDLFPRPSKL